MRHAPRGPIKAHAKPLAPDDLIDSPSLRTAAQRAARCTATNRRGTRCGARAIAGATVCRLHGGASPQVKAAAAKRLEELKPAAIQYYEWLLNQNEYPSAGLGAANSVMDRVDGRPVEHVQMDVTAKPDLSRLSDEELALVEGILARARALPAAREAESTKES